MVPIIYIIAITIGLGVFLYHVVLYMRTRVPIVITPTSYIHTLIEHIHGKELLSNSMVYELGSGWGTFSFAAEAVGAKKVTGYELSPIHIWWSRRQAKKRRSQVCFKRKDFFSADLSDATLLYVYLVPKVVKKLCEKIKKECRPGTHVIVLGHPIHAFSLVRKIPTQPGNPNSTYFYIYKV